MASPDVPVPAPSRSRLGRAARVLIVSSITFTFISYWRTAAVVLCDLASTAYYIGGIVENAIGPAAPWFILAVMVFSYAVRSVYIESSALFVRGGVYRVVKEAMGGFLAKLSVSALMFDYILTGPTSGVSAGTYIMRLLLLFLKFVMPAEVYHNLHLDRTDPGDPGEVVTRWGAVLICALITLYFFRQNLLGIHESSDKALKIMIATTIMAVIMFVWCGITLVANRGGVNPVLWPPDLHKKHEHAERKPGKYPDSLSAEERARLQERDALLTEQEKSTTVNIQDLDRDKAPDRLRPREKGGEKVPRDNEALKKVGIEVQDDPLGLLGRLTWFDFLRGVGVLGLFIAFGHSILAMSGEETLAQVYREVESPKLPNFKRAAFIVFVYSVLLTAGISFLAVMLIPDEVRMKFYQDNLIGGLARHVVGPTVLKLCLETFVVVVGFLILSGAVNTAIIGSNGVLNRVAEDGVLPDWFLRPHPRYGTTYRVLILITLMQLGVILFSRGDMVILGEAYAFGVVWSFVFKALAMVVLRFKDKTPREYKVPLNVRLGGVELPIGLSLIFLVLLVTAVLNLFTKEVATVSGIGFTLVFLTVFLVSEHYHERKRQGAHHQHLEQFNRQTTDEVSPPALGLSKPYRKLVAIRSPQNLFMLEKTLAETDPQTTDVVVMTAKVIPPGDTKTVDPDLDAYDQELMTAVVDRAERAGKEVRPLIVPTNNPLHAILKTAQDLHAQEVIMGVSNKYTADEQLEQTAFYWISLHEGHPPPLTVRILSRARDVSLDLAGGNRIPKITERRARSVAELRAAGIGVDRVLLAHDGTPAGAELFDAVLTMLDPQVTLDLVAVGDDGPAGGNGRGAVEAARERARQLGREVAVHTADGSWADAVVRLARDRQDDLIILPLPAERPTAAERPWWDAAVQHVLDNAHCKVLLAAPPLIPRDVEE
jgi:amino acid transporter/nucleotide-binding universal stress UspA family protein